MIWYEVIEDLGDGSCATRRFKTWEEASIATTVRDSILSVSNLA